MSPAPASKSQTNPISVRLSRITPQQAVGISLLIAGIAVWSLNGAGPVQPVLQTWSEVRLGLSSSEVEPPAPVMNPVAPLLPSASEATVHKPAVARKLTKEQQTLAQFLAKRYRVALDSTQEFVDHAYRVARDMKLDPWLILAIMGIESSFDPNATSNKGAQGLMQVLTRVHADKFAPFGGVAAAFDPLANIRVGARILKGYIDRDGSIEAALKSYVGAAFMADDRGYGEKVLTERERLAAIAEGRPMVPPVINRVPAAVAAPLDSVPMVDAKLAVTAPANAESMTKDVVSPMMTSASGDDKPAQANPSESVRDSSAALKAD